MSSQAMRYETIIREAEDDGRNAGDTLVELLRDVDSRVGSIEERSATIDELEIALRSYGTEKVDLLLNPILTLIKSKADLGALLNTETLSLLRCVTGPQSCVIDPQEARASFAPSRYLTFVATDNPSLSFVAEKLAYDTESGALDINVLNVVGTGAANGWDISPAAMANNAATVRIAPTDLFAGPNLQLVIEQISAAVAGKLNFDSTTVFGRTLMAAVDKVNARESIGAAPLSHGHGISDVSGLQTALDNKATRSNPDFIGTSTLAEAVVNGLDSSDPLKVVRTQGVDQVSIKFTTSVSGPRWLGFSGGVLKVGTGENIGSGTYGTIVSLDGHVHTIASVTGLQAALDARTVTGHVHAITDITNLTTTLAGKASATHTHAIGDITNLQTTLSGKASTSHSHAIADVSGLQAALDAKSATGHSHTISDVTGLQTALDGKAASTHTHAQADVSGLVTALATKAPLASPAFTGAGSIPALNIGSSAASPLKLSRTTTELISGEYATPIAGSRFLGFNAGVLQTGATTALGTVVTPVRKPSLFDQTSGLSTSGLVSAPLSQSLSYGAVSATGVVLVQMFVSGNIVGNANAADDYTYMLEPRYYDGSAWVSLGYQQSFGDFNAGVVAAARQQNFGQYLRPFILDRTKIRSDQAGAWTLRSYGNPEYANQVLTGVRTTIVFTEFEP